MERPGLGRGVFVGAPRARDCSPMAVDSLPAAQGRVGEGCFARDAASSTPSQPPPAMQGEGLKGDRSFADALPPLRRRGGLGRGALQGTQPQAPPPNLPLQCRGRGGSNGGSVLLTPSPAAQGRVGEGCLFSAGGPQACGLQAPPLVPALRSTAAAGARWGASLRLASGPPRSGPSQHSCCGRSAGRKPLACKRPASFRPFAAQLLRALRTAQAFGLQARPFAPSYNARCHGALGAPFYCRESAPAVRVSAAPLSAFRPGTEMLNSLLTRVFGSRNDRLLRQLQRTVVRINALEPEMEKLSDAELQAKTPEFQQRIAGGESLDKILPEAFAVCREASRARAGHAPLRRPADRRHGAAPGQDRRDAHRRRQDPRRHAAGVPECAGRQGRPRGHRQRLPGAPRLGVDGQALQLAGPERGRGVPGHAAR